MKQECFRHKDRALRLNGIKSKIQTTIHEVNLRKLNEAKINKPCAFIIDMDLQYLLVPT